MGFIQEIKDGTYLINLNEYKSIGTHWLTLYINGDKITYFDGFTVEYIAKEIKKILGNKNIATNIFIIKGFNSIMSGFFCIAFIDFALKPKRLLDFTSLFFPNKYEKNHEIF